MDATLQKITDFAFQLDYADLTPEAIHECKRRFVDSLAFLVSAALLYGWVDAATYSKERMFDPRLRALRQKVKVVYDKELDKLQPQSVPCRLEVVLKRKMSRQ